MFQESIQSIARVLQTDPSILFITGAGSQRIQVCHLPRRWRTL